MAVSHMIECNVPLGVSEMDLSGNYSQQAGFIIVSHITVTSLLNCGLI